MTRRRFGLGALLALAALVSVMAWPSAAGAAGADNPPHGSIIGKVFQPPATPGGPPVPVAEATVRLVRNGHVVAQTQTNPEGKYAFPNIPPGHYKVAAFKQGVGHGVRRTIVFPAQVVIVPILLHE